MSLVMQSAAQPVSSTDPLGSHEIVAVLPGMPMVHPGTFDLQAVFNDEVIGSLRVLWPWPEGTNGTTLAFPSGDVWIPVLLAIAGAVVVLMMSRREAAIVAEVVDAGEAAETVS